MAWPGWNGAASREPRCRSAFLASDWRECVSRQRLFNDVFDDFLGKLSKQQLMHLGLNQAPWPIGNRENPAAHAEDQQALEPERPMMMRNAKPCPAVFFKNPASLKNSLDMLSKESFDRNLLDPNLSGFWCGARLFSNFGLAVFALALVGLACVWPSAALGQEEDELPTRPSSNRVLPEETVLYFRIRSFPDFFKEFEGSGIGKLARDERVAPFLNDLYDNAKQTYDENAKENLDGIELDQFKDLVAGEMCFALVAKRRKELEGILIVDVNPESDIADRLLGVAKQATEDGGEGEAITEVEDDIEIEIMTGGGDRDLHYFRIENTVYLCTNRDLCAEMIANIKGEPLEKTRTFFENRKYRTIMGHCRVDKDHPPLLTFFVDPIELFKTTTRGNATGAIATSVLPVLGLDGVLGAGGAVLPSDDVYQSLNHFHVLMASPREGLLKSISFQAGEYNLSNVVPADTAALLVSSIDIPQLYAGIESINDTFRGKDSLAGDLDRASEEVGVDLKVDVIDALTGRLSLITWSNPTATAFNGASNAYLLGLHDGEKARETVETLIARIEEENEDAVKTSRKDGVDYWYFSGADDFQERQRERRLERMEALDEAEREAAERNADRDSRLFRFPVPAFTFIDDELVITDSIEMMEHLIDTYKGKVDSLNDSEDYQTVRKQAEILLDGQKPAGIVFSRPSSQLAPFWNLLAGDDVKSLIRDNADDQPALGRLADSLERNELPKAEELSGYFPTTGGFMTDDSTGLHFLAFELKPNSKDKKKK